MTSSETVFGSVAAAVVAAEPDEGIGAAAVGAVVVDVRSGGVEISLATLR